MVYQSDVLYLDGKVYTGTDCSLSNGVIGCQYAPGHEPDPSSIGPQLAWYVITGDNYWQVVALESAIMLAGGRSSRGVRAVLGGAAPADEPRRDHRAPG